MKYFVVGIRQPRNSAHPKKRARQALLSLVLNRQPKSLTALAELTGRQAPNLSRSLWMMESYGLIKLKREGRNVEPEVLATEFLIVLNDPTVSEP